MKPFARGHSLERKVPINRYIQSHTILKSIAHRFDGKHVLVLGGRGNTLKSVAHR